LDRSNGQLIRKAAGVTTVDMFGCSDAGGHMLGGTLYVKGKETFSAFLHGLSCFGLVLQDDTFCEQIFDYRSKVQGRLLG
jgi:hypothetical protein